MSCLFDSLEYFLKISSKDIREKICDYLENSNQLVDGLDTKDLLEIESEDYIRKMRKKSTWGGGIEIKSACNIWNLRIIVINLRNSKSSSLDKSNPWIEFIPNNNDSKISTIFLSWNGYHYEPVKNILDPEHFIQELEKYSHKKKKTMDKCDDEIKVKDNYINGGLNQNDNHSNNHNRNKNNHTDKKSKRERKEERKKNKKSNRK